MSSGPLSDIRVIDLTQMLAGPYGTMFLADLGADVIKIESPQGDLARPGGPFHPDDEQKSLGGYFQSVNRNKKSVVLDLKTAEGIAALKKLVADADAVIENFRGGVMEKLGLSYEALKESNPRLVYGALRGFGDTRTGTSPYYEWPAYDVVAQAMGGIMGITGEYNGDPTKIGPGVGDLVPGLMLALGVVSAVHHAKRTGEGQFVDVAMLDAILSLSERIVYQYSISGEVPGPIGSGHPFMCPFGMFPAKDGFVTIAAPQQEFFDTLCQEIGVPELANDERFSSLGRRGRNKRELIYLLSEATVTFTKAELQDRLGGRIPFGPVMNAQEILNDPHFQARDMLVEVDQPGSQRRTIIAGAPIKLSDTPATVRNRAPLLGEHTEDVLRAAGLTSPEIDALRPSKKERE